MTGGARDSADPPAGRGAHEREPLDLRLALGAGLAWVAVLLCGTGSPFAALVAAGVAAAGGATALAAGHRWRDGARTVALALFVVALVLLPLAGRVARARASPLYQLAADHAEVTVEVTVTADPRPLAATGVAGAPRVAVETSPQVVTVGDREVGASLTSAVLVLADAGPWRDLLPGQRVRVDGTLQPDLRGSALSVTMFARSPPELLGRPPWYQRVAGSVRSALRTAVAGLPTDVRGLLPGLVDGDTTALDPVLADRFRVAGLTHLVAVSGTNCSLLIGAVLLALRGLRVRPWVCAVAGGAVLVLFVLVARPSPSVLRAALMAGVALVSLATGRPRTAVPSLAGVVVGLLIWDPTLGASASFAMSVLATGALLMIAPHWARALRARRVPPGLAESVAVAAAAHLVTIPVVAALYGRVSLVAVAANVLAEPVVGITTIAGFGAAVLAPLWLSGGVVLAWLAGWPCRWLIAVANFFGSLHGATIPWPGGVAGGLALLLLVVVVIAAAARAGPRRVLAAAGVTAVAVLLPVRAVTSGWPPPGWIFVACDVGQGDALVLNAGSNAAVEIDAGPDPVLIDRCLRDLHVTAIPLLVLTHFHLDHVGGLTGAVRQRRVGAVLAGPLDDPASGSELVHSVAAQLGLTVRTPPVGSSLDVGNVHLDVLGPPFAFSGTRSDPNNSSLVLRATVDGVRLMLPGDAEIEEQQWLLGSGADLRADVLKIPHHGSAYSDPAFLAAVHAWVGIISVGLHNDYGHPSPVLLQEMAQLGVPLLRTDRDGDVAVTAQNGRLHTVVHGLSSSTVGMASVFDARMAACPRVPPPPTTCPRRCPASCCSSATKNCWSIVPSARSPPLPGGRIRRSSRPSAAVARSRARSCTSCSAPRCSASHACSWCALRRTYASPPRQCSRRTSSNRPRAPSSSFSTPAAPRARPSWKPPARRRRSRSGA